MIEPHIPYNDEERLRVLYSYGIFESEIDPALMELTRATRTILNMPIAYISFIDRDHQLFVTSNGIKDKIADRSTSFCGHAINDPAKVMIVKDARMDVRFFDNPWVVKHPHVVFYAGAPLISSDGFALGTLCVIDFKANDLTDGQVMELKNLAAQVVIELEKKRGEYIQLKKVD